MEAQTLSGFGLLHLKYSSVRLKGLILYILCVINIYLFVRLFVVVNIQFVTQHLPGSKNMYIICDLSLLLTTELLKYPCLSFEERCKLLLCVILASEPAGTVF